MNDGISLNLWLEQLAAKQPTPGGGGAAALLAATAAALVGMVSIYTTGPKWADESDRMQAIHAEADSLRVRARELIAADAAAFTAVGSAYSLPKATEDEKLARQAAIQTALIGATKPPQAVAEIATQIIALAKELVVAGNPNVISDVAVAAASAKAALESAIVNIAINAKLITDTSVSEDLSACIKQAEAAINQASEVITKTRARMEQ